MANHSFDSKQVVSLSHEKLSGHDLRDYLKVLSTQIFSELQSKEVVGLSLHSEQSQFFRFNQSKVRQNTHVHQHELTVTYQNNERSMRSQVSLTLDLATDRTHLLELVQLSRQQTQSLDVSPQFVALKNNGVSEAFHRAERPNDTEALNFITSELATDDAAGLYTSGPVRKASVNSLGQFHFFESDQFFFDYSLYSGPRAAKGFYSASKWNEKAFADQIRSTRQKLSLLKSPLVEIKKGRYRVFLEPMAIAEIVGTLSWGGLSLGAHKQGRAPLRRLSEGQSRLSPQFSLSENLGLGYTPQFNSLGELAPLCTELISQGELKSFLVSSSSSKEYNVESNFAESSEGLRSPEIRAGTLRHSDALRELGTGLYLSNLHYINWSDLSSARLTGMTRYACFWVEGGEIRGPIQDLRFDETLYNMFGDKLLSLTAEQESFCDTSTYVRRSLGGMRVPGALIEDFNFTL